MKLIAVTRRKDSDKRLKRIANGDRSGRLEPAMRPHQGRRVCEAVEITVPTLPGRVERVIPEEEVEKSFPQPGQLLEAVPMPGIGDGQIEEFQRPEEGQPAIFGIALIEPIEGSFDLAPDIGQLFD